MGTGFRLRMAQRERTSFHPSDFTAEELDGYLTRMFHISDENKDGVLQPAELTMMLSFSKFNIPADQIAQLVSAADTNQDGVINYDEFVPVLRGLMQALPMQDGSFGYSIDTTTNQQAAEGEAWESPREYANDYWKSPTCPFDVSDLLGDEAPKAAPATDPKPRASLSVNTGFAPGMSVERDIDNTWYPAVVVESPPASPGQSPTYNIKYTDDGNEEVGVEEDELRVKPEAAEAAEAALSQVKANVSANLAARAEAKALESTLTDICAQAEAFRNQAKAEAAAEKSLRRAAMTAAHLPDQPISPCTAARSASRVTEAMAARTQARNRAPAVAKAAAAKAAAAKALESARAAADKAVSPCTAARSASRVTEAMAAQMQAREQAAREQAMAAKAAADEAAAKAAAESALVEYAARTVLLTVHAAKGQFKVVCKPSDTVLQLKHKVTVAADAQCVDLSPWKSSSCSNCSIRIDSRYMSEDDCELSAYCVESGSVLYLEISPTQHSNQYRSRTARYH